FGSGGFLFCRGLLRLGDGGGFLLSCGFLGFRRDGTGLLGGFESGSFISGWRRTFGAGVLGFRRGLLLLAAGRCFRAAPGTGRESEGSGSSLTLCLHEGTGCHGRLQIFLAEGSQLFGVHFVVGGNEFFYGLQGRTAAFFQALDGVRHHLGGGWMRRFGPRILGFLLFLGVSRGSGGGGGRGRCRLTFYVGHFFFVALRKH